jgi:hypothetical protein
LRYSKKSSDELRLTELVKIQRTITRLKHSIAADRELNEQIPSIADRHYEAIGRGELLQISEVSLDEKDLK